MFGLEPISWKQSNYAGHIFCEGECWLRLGDHGKAKEALRQAVQLGHHERSFVALANIHEMEGDTQAAIDIYKAAVEYVWLSVLRKTLIHS